MNKKILGPLILVVVVLGIVAAKMFGGASVEQGPAPPNLDPVTVSVLYGGEKAGLLQNEKVLAILRDRYHITLNASKRGSIEMVTTDDTAKVDCLWPSNQVAVELARNSGKKILSSDNIFNSPVVFYAWSGTADALMQKGLVEKRGDVYYITKPRDLVEMSIANKRWKEDLGVNAYGPIRIYSTDPKFSNSGNMWASLLANLLNNGEVVTPDTLPSVLPRIDAYFKSLGYMERSSDDIFKSFLSQGEGSRPIIVGYESQLPEYMLQNAGEADYIKKNIRILYPEPTVYASHPLISMTLTCKRLQTALIDPELQRLAWREHGFRTGLSGSQSDPTQLNLTGVPQKIGQVIPMPQASVVQDLLSSFN
jgi:hypothetical protein